MKKLLHSFLRKSCHTISFFSCLFVLLAFTDIPYWAYYNLASVEEKLDGNPETIVIMGGDGMPSPSGLMRLYYGTQKALLHPKSNIIIALPYNEYDSIRQLNLMAHELVLNGIDTNRISYAAKGFNTASQVQEISEKLLNKSAGLLVVTSPEHMYRCIATFRKAGFKNVGSSPSFEKPSDEEKLKDKSKEEKLRIRNLSLRYNLWSYMQYEIIVMREYTAITYYWVKGWI